MATCEALERGGEAVVYPRRNTPVEVEGEGRARYTIGSRLSVVSRRGCDAVVIVVVVVVVIVAVAVAVVVVVVVVVVRGCVRRRCIGPQQDDSTGEMVGGGGSVVVRWWRVS